MAHSRWRNRALTTPRELFSSSLQWDSPIPLSVKAEEALQGVLREDTSPETSWLHMRDQDGHKAIYYAIKDGSVEMVQFLLNEDPNLFKGCDGTDDQIYNSMLVHTAVERQEPEILECILEAWAPVNNKCKLMERPDWTPLHRACNLADSDNCVKVVKILIAFDADLNIKDSDKQTALHMVLHSRWNLAVNNALASLLLCNGAEADCRDERGQSPLFLAVKNGRFKMAKKLVEKYNVSVFDQVGGRLFTTMQKMCKDLQHEVSIIALVCNFRPIPLWFYEGSTYYARIFFDPC